MNEIWYAYVSSPEAHKTSTIPNCHSNSKLAIFIIRAGAGLNLVGPYCFFSDDFFVPRHRIFHCLNITQNSPPTNLEYTFQFHNLFLSSISTTRWFYNQGKCILPHNSHIVAVGQNPSIFNTIIFQEIKKTAYFLSY